MPQKAPPGSIRSAGLALLQKDMESAHNSPPTTLMAARQCLDQLTMSAGEVVAAVNAFAPDGAGLDGQAAWWARAFADQCRAALDELAFFSSLTPSTAPVWTQYRRCAIWRDWAANAPCRGSRTSNGLRCDRLSSAVWSMTSCSTRSAIS